LAEEVTSSRSAAQTAGRPSRLRDPYPDRQNGGCRHLMAASTHEEGAHVRDKQTFERGLEIWKSVLATEFVEKSA